MNMTVAMGSTPTRTVRILVVDDNADARQAFHDILLPAQRLRSERLVEVEQLLFGGACTAPPQLSGWEVALERDGESACQHVAQAWQQGVRYALAFVDMRMPGGWDGLETVRQLWRIDPQLEVAICSAYCDYTWADIVSRLGRGAQLRLLPKPLDADKIRGLAQQCAASYLACH